MLLICLHEHVNEFKDSNQDTAAAKSMSEQIEKEKAQDVVVAENEVTS